MILKGKAGLIATGRLTKDAESKVVGEKKRQKVSFGVAVGEKGEKEFINVVCWGKQAHYAANLSKGDEVFVVGREESRDYNGKTYTDVTASYISKQPEIPFEHGEASAANPDRDNASGDMQEIDEDMPF